MMIDSKKMCEILASIAEKVQEQKDFLTELDNEIGDGDHGINLARGFGAVKEKLPGLADKDVGAILKESGMTLVSTVGGASGPLYGTAFMKAIEAYLSEKGICQIFLLTDKDVPAYTFYQHNGFTEQIGNVAFAKRF